jgi:predicted phage baseplate assembly protein
LQFLSNQYYNLDWIETAKIEKIDNGKTIKISYQKNSLLLKLNDEQTKVNLEIDDVRTDKISVKIENGKLYKELIDKTHHLSTSGTIKISIAGQMAKKNVEDHDRYWLRCVVEDGTYDIPPKIDQIRLNTVDAVQRSKEKQDRFSGSGLPDFCIDIKDVPVLDAMKDEGTPTPQITVDNDQLPWKKVEDFDASKSGDEHYTMDLKSGRICFGDGIHGKIPPEGKDNILISYRTGGGVRGNVNAGAINRVDDDLAARISVTNYRPASGGEDAETLEEAIQRARKDLKTPYRAVTSQDYERLAINTPGVRVARARALPGYYPGKNSPVAGIVSVIVVPKVEDGTVNPELSQGFLKTVYEHLDKRRLLTTELVVLRPGYEEITVEATVRIHPRFVGSAVADEVKKKLNDFLHPIRGGPDGTGWPFGRTVYRSEIYEVIDRVEGVDHVRSVSLARNGTRSSDDIAILPHSLVYSGSHRIEVQEIKEGVDD